MAFPMIALEASSPQFTFLYPWGPGRLKRGMWAGSFMGPYFTYPSHCAAMQFMACYDAQLGDRIVLRDARSAGWHQGDSGCGNA